MNRDIEEERFLEEQEAEDEGIIKGKREKGKKVFGVKLKQQTDNPQCISEEQKEIFGKMLKDKQISLEKELEKEKQHYEKYGLYSNRDIEEIEDQLKIVNNVLKNFDSLSICDPSL